MYCDRRVGCREFVLQYTVVYCDRGQCIVTQYTVNESLFGHCSQDFLKIKFFLKNKIKPNKMRQNFLKIKFSKIKFLMLNMIEILNQFFGIAYKCRVRFYSSTC